MGVAAEHPLPGMRHQFVAVDGIVVQADGGKRRIDAGKRGIGVNVARPLIIQPNDPPVACRRTIGFQIMNFAIAKERSGHA